MTEVTLPGIPAGRVRLVRRARLLSWGGNAWHGVEFLIAVAAGAAASSVALVGFGIDSLIESFAGFVVLWRLSGRRADSQAAERRAQQLVSASFLRLPLDRTPRGPARERGRGLVVGRPRRRARDRSGRAARGSRGVARRRLLRSVLMRMHVKQASTAASEPARASVPSALLDG